MSKMRRRGLCFLRRFRLKRRISRSLINSSRASTTSPVKVRRVARQCQFGALRSGAATTGKGMKRPNRKLIKLELHVNPAPMDLGRIKAGEDLLLVADLRRYAARTDARAKGVPHAGIPGDRARPVRRYLKNILTLRAHHQAISPQLISGQETSMSILPNLTLIGSKHILGARGVTWRRRRSE